MKDKVYFDETTQVLHVNEHNGASYIGGIGDKAFIRISNFLDNHEVELKELKEILINNPKAKKLEEIFDRYREYEHNISNLSLTIPTIPTINPSFEIPEDCANMSIIEFAEKFKELKEKNKKLELDIAACIEKNEKLSIENRNFISYNVDNTKENQKLSDYDRKAATDYLDVIITDKEKIMILSIENKKLKVDNKTLKQKSLDKDTELVEFYKFLSERAIIDDCCRGEGEAESAVKLYNKSKIVINKEVDLDELFGAFIKESRASMFNDGRKTNIEIKIGDIKHSFETARLSISNVSQRVGIRLNCGIVIEGISLGEGHLSQIKLGYNEKK